MLLRRVIDHVRDQNWFAVALEFVIVVSGVLLAFQVSEWSADQANREAERLYLSTMAGELDLIAERLESDMDNLREYRSRTRLFLGAAEAGDFDTAKQHLLGPVAVTRILSEGIVPASLNELLSSGRLLIIRSPELRMALAQLPMENLEFQTLSGQLQLQQSQIVDAVSRRVVLGAGEDFSIEGFQFGPEDRDEELFRQLRYAIYLNRVLAIYADNYRDDVIEMQAMVCAELPAADACQETPSENEGEAP